MSYLSVSAIANVSSITGVWLDSVGSTANSAYGQANIAYTQANTSYNTANTGFTTANNAFAKANAALANTSTTLSGNLAITGTVSANGNYITPYTGMKNRIINGAMMIDQRNGGASSTGTNVYTVDRWGFAASVASKFTWGQNYNSVTPPVGFSNYLGFVSSSAYSIGAGEVFAIYQPIEGFNFYDCAWGTASAKTVTLSFQVYSSLTGTFGGTIRNSAGTRSYPFSYSIGAANTWTSISVTIAGDTTGTWIGATNGVGAYVQFSLGTGSTYSGTANAWSAGNYYAPTGAVSVVGTSGATFYITGVQLELGPVATPFESRLYGQELALCQRYYAKTFNTSVAPAEGLGTDYLFYKQNTTYPEGVWHFPVEMRTAPTVTKYNFRSGGSAGQWTNSSSDSSNARVLTTTTRWAGFDNTAIPVSASQWWLGGATASAEL